MRSKCRSVLVHMTHRVVFMAYSIWVQVMHTRERLQRLVFRIKNMFLVSLFAAWRDVAACEAERRRKMLKICQRLGNRALFFAFAQWREEPKRAHRQHALQLVVSRMMSRVLVCALETWRGRKEERLLMRRKAGGVMKRMKQRSIAKSLDSRVV